MERVFNTVTGVFQRWWKWFEKRAHGPHATFWLMVLAFLDSSIVSFPPDLILGAILFAGAERWVFFTLITIISSIAGALFGYIVGAFFFDVLGMHIITFLDVGDLFVRAQGLYAENTFWIIFAAALTPIPYIPFVLAAGFFGVGVWVFLLASILGRTIRFFAVGFIIKTYGEQVYALVARYSILATIIVVVGVALWLLFHFGFVTPFSA